MRAAFYMAALAVSLIVSALIADALSKLRKEPRNAP